MQRSHWTRAVIAPGPLNMVRWRIALSAALIVAIFLLDTFTQLGGAVAVLYVMPLLLVAGDLRQMRFIPWSIACAGLTLISFGVNHGPHFETDAILRMLISLAANCVTTFLILRAKTMFTTLLSSERRYRSIFNSLAVAIWEHDFRPVQAAIDAVRAGGVQDLRRYIAENPQFVTDVRRMVRITDVNHIAVRLMKVRHKSEFFSHLSDFLPETDESFAECILAIDERRPVFQAETRITAHDGEPLDVIIAMSFDSGIPLDRVPGSVLDVTVSKRLSEVIVQTRAQLERAQHAAALGQLSATIAHEINQPLSAIRSYADASRRWLRREPPNIDEANAALAMVAESVRHVGEIIRGVRALTGTASSETSLLTIDGLIEDSVILMQRELSANATRLSLELDAANICVEADRVLIQQVFVNLITNAIQAMSDNAPACRLITITSRVDARQIEIAISDCGPGWAPGLLEAAFEAFHTTKADGMGLGLSICRTAIETHGGDIAISNRPNGGACVSFRLPVADTANLPESMSESMIA